jgi:hypothetical protein
MKYTPIAMPIIATGSGLRLNELTRGWNGGLRARTDLLDARAVTAAMPLHVRPAQAKNPAFPAPRC